MTKTGKDPKMPRLFVNGEEIKIVPFTTREGPEVARMRARLEGAYQRRCETLQKMVDRINADLAS